MSLFKDFLIESSVLRISFVVFTGDESDLIKLMTRYLLEMAEESVIC